MSTKEQNSTTCRKRRGYSQSNPKTKSKRIQQRCKRNNFQTCPGCEKWFPNVKSKMDMINCHMQIDDQCKSYIIDCPNIRCEEKFLNQNGLDRHLKANSACLNAEKQLDKIRSYPCTGVPISSRKVNAKGKSFHYDSAFKSVNANGVEYTEEIIDHKNMDIVYYCNDMCTTKAPLQKSDKPSITCSSSNCTTQSSCFINESRQTCCLDDRLNETSPQEKNIQPTHYAPASKQIYVLEEQKEQESLKNTKENTFKTLIATIMTVM